MNERKKILRFTAIMLLAAFTFLFLHSETELFDEHTEQCKDLDLSLILEKARFDDFHNIDDSMKITFDYVNVALFDINYDYETISKWDYFSPGNYSDFQYRTFIKNRILLI